MIAIYVRVARWRRAIEHDPEASAYMDQALTPVADDEEEDRLTAHKNHRGRGLGRARQKGGRSLAP